MTTPLRAIGKTLGAALALLFACGVAAAQDLPLAAEKPTPRVHARDSGAWEVLPAQLGIGRLVETALVAKPATSIPYSATSIIEVEVSSEQPLVAGLFGIRPNESREVFPLRALEAGENKMAWWAIEDRIGAGVDLDGVALSLGVESDSPTTATVHAVRLYKATEVPDHALLAASLYAPLTLQFHEPQFQQQQQALVSLPEEYVRRHQEGSIVLTNPAGEMLARVDIKNPPEDQQGVYQWQIDLPHDSTPGSSGTVILALREGMSSMQHVLASVSWSVPAADRPYRQFEFPFQSIVDYDVRSLRTDLGLVMITRDFGACDEPAGLQTASHEVHAARVSLRTGRFEAQPAWRVPASAHWAAGGFQSIVTGYIRNTMVFFITGVDDFGMASTGFASTVGSSPVRPGVVNPVFWPEDQSTGWREGMSLMTRGNALAVYGRSYLMLSATQAGENQPRLVASTSTDLRTFADAGVVPFADLVDGHVSLYVRDDVYYLFTNDTSLVWASLDPLREWSPYKVDMPEGWRNLRISEVQEQTYLLGLFDLDGRAVVRWMPLEFEGDDVPLPRIVAPN